MEYHPEWVRAILIKLHAKSWSLPVDNPIYDEMSNDEFIHAIIGEPISKD